MNGLIFYGFVIMGLCILTWIIWGCLKLDYYSIMFNNNNNNITNT